MAIYRQIQIDFWQDNFVTDLSAEDRYFFIYLLTNSNTSQSGVYQINVKLAAFELGWDREQVNKLIKRFVEYGKIEYDETTSEIMIVNWLKYNKATSPKVAKVIDREIKSIKNEHFKDTLIQLCALYGYPIDTVSIPNRNNNKNNNQNNNKNNNHNEEPTKEAAASENPLVSSSVDYEDIEFEIEEPENPLISKDFGAITTFWQTNIGPLSQHVGQLLGAMVDEHGLDLTLHALQTAVEQNKATVKYIEGILRNWHKENYKTVEDVQAGRQRYANQQKIKREEHVPEWLNNPSSEDDVPKTPEEQAKIDEIRKRLQESIAKSKERKHGNQNQFTHI